jgi:pimeloyl-ACP methyl ester carboxylesterase
VAIAVEFPGCDATTLRGECLLRSDDWVVAAHDSGEDLDTVGPVAWLWAQDGPSFLAFDLRGHGMSDGHANLASVPGDIAAACRFAKDRCAQHISLLAIGASATQAVRAPLPDGVGALVLFSPPQPTLGKLPGLQQPLVAKLILYGAHDEEMARAAEALRRSCAGWASTVGFPTARQGRELLRGRWGAYVGERVQRFVDEQRYLATLPMRRF